VDWINLTGAKKVHSLIDKVYKRKNLEMAWERVKANQGSGGVDGETLKTFEAQLDQQLDRLQRELKRTPISLNRYGNTPSRRGTNQVSIVCLAYPRFMTGCVSKRCSIGWSLSSSRYSMMPASDIGEGDRRRTPCAKCGKRYKAGRSGSLMRISEIFWIEFQMTAKTEKRK
jgi:hypothetical protein